MAEEIIIKVMLADDHILMREGIKQLLEYDGDIQVIAEAGTGKECLEKLERISPDVLLLDINMPQMNGLEVLTEIRKKKYETKVLMLTVHNTIEYLVQAMDMDADGYILKESEFSELKKAIFDVYHNKKYIQPSMIPLFNSKLISKDRDRELVASLTNRELEVLILVSIGLFNKEIALKLNISERTVKNHISNIFKKIEVVDRTQAAVFAIKNDLVKI